ncbi:hypothetical protein MUK42_07869 [Musa troglodytarum]|uniref:Uncharacterized protein n=1 Tax=Musa troglodytarum TaxID=320322 RepID=A0A9E7GRB5_9LILI|nr:hypothetical protein MUK42_07869 [Musa troglodytarum]
MEYNKIHNAISGGSGSRQGVQGIWDRISKNEGLLLELGSRVEADRRRLGGAEDTKAMVTGRMTNWEATEDADFKQKKNVARARGAIVDFTSWPSHGWRHRRTKIWERRRSQRAEEASTASQQPVAWRVSVQQSLCWIYQFFNPPLPKKLPGCQVVDTTTGSRPWLSVAKGQTGVTQPKEAEKLMIILHGREVTLPAQHSTPLSRCIVRGSGQGSHQAASDM